jgi:hypothetical protein
MSGLQRPWYLQVSSLYLFSTTDNSPLGLNSTPLLHNQLLRLLPFHTKGSSVEFGTEYSTVGRLLLGSIFLGRFILPLTLPVQQHAQQCRSSGFDDVLLAAHTRVAVPFVTLTVADTGEEACNPDWLCSLNILLLRRDEETGTQQVFGVVSLAMVGVDRVGGGELTAELESDAGAPRS